MSTLPVPRLVCLWRSLGLPLRALATLWVNALNALWAFPGKKKNREELLLTVGKWRAERLIDAPIIDASTHPSIGENIQGPSLVAVPPWISNRLGNYYLYFADHKGRYIRLAYADELAGPWIVHVPGSLQLEQSYFPTEPLELDDEILKSHQGRAAQDKTRLPHDLRLELTTPHIASPDVHVDEDSRRVVMYFHGLQSPGMQLTRVATSLDGVVFEARPETLARSYFRVFEHRGNTYGMAMPGQLYRKNRRGEGFEEGPRLFNPDMRHFGLWVNEDVLHVFWTQVGHAPERILASTIDISRPFMSWEVSEPVDVLRPERTWEGAEAPLEPSIRSVAYGHVNQLRDPAIFAENGRLYLLYAVAGEAGIGIAELHQD